ncbi:MAG: hypothetical protein KF780_12755 [Sphingomonas sp.]|nr:hypothetical protein [Sphingomonas sp.]
MTRLILTILVALSLVSAPGAAFAGPAAGCTMEGMSAMNGMRDMSGMDGDHDKMACCTPDCAIGCPAGVVPGAGTSGSDEPLAALPFAGMIARAPSSLGPGTADPPPRASFL